MRLFCFVQEKTFCRYGCIYFLAVLMLVCVDVMVNLFVTVLFSVCSAVTVKCCVLYPCCMGVFGMFAVM